MSNTAIRVHVLYESSSGGPPHGCSEIRLLRPLSHPSLQSEIILSSGLQMPSHLVDVVIIERLWDYSCNMEQHSAFLHQLRKNNIRVIFEIDDDILSLNSEPGDSNWPTTQQKMWIRWMLRSADGVIVSTQSLADRLTLLNKNIEVVPNALDDRLFEQSRKFRVSSNNDHLIFGYMGTLTHMEDLISIIGPLRRVLARHKNYITFEIVGIGNNKIIESAFCGLPVRIRQVPPKMVIYSNFTEWMQHNLRWDFGIAPLINSAFTKSKSDIKFLDYAVQGIPGIFSVVPAYKDTVRHMENGLLANTAEEWENCLEHFVTDSDLRIRLGQCAHTEVWKHRMLTNMARNWIVAIQNILSKSTGTHRTEVSYDSKLPQSPVPYLNFTKNVTQYCAGKRSDSKNLNAGIDGTTKAVEPKTRQWDISDITDRGERVIHLYANDCYYAHLSIYHFAAQWCIDANVLDAGSGTGYGSAYLARYGARSVLGIDVSPKAIEFGRASFDLPNLEFREMDLGQIADLPPSSNVDIIFCSNVLEHLQDVGGFLRGCTRLLVPSGRALFVMPPITSRAQRDADLQNVYHINSWSPKQWMYVISQYFLQVQAYGHFFTKPTYRLNFLNSPEETQIDETDFVFQPIAVEDFYDGRSLSAIFLASQPRHITKLPTPGSRIQFIDASISRSPPSGSKS